MVSPRYRRDCLETRTEVNKHKENRPRVSRDQHVATWK